MRYGWSFRARAVAETLSEPTRLQLIVTHSGSGITALCSSIKKRTVGGNSRDAGIFECPGVAIVNGAQTVATITDLSDSVAEQLATARVPIRNISLDGCPPEFANEVTRATNTQNRADARNLVTASLQLAPPLLPVSTHSLYSQTVVRTVLCFTRDVDPQGWLADMLGRMFLRAAIRKKDGKEHRYFSVVENCRIGRRRV
jgi:hypothetical protein